MDLLELAEHLPDETLGSLADGLIRLYDFQNRAYVSESQKMAADLVAGLASKHEVVLDKVIENAHRYAKLMSYEDADQYCPNSFEVLSEIGCARSRNVLELYARSPSLLVSFQAYDCLKRCTDD